jgi:hypothetical protein
MATVASAAGRAPVTFTDVLASACTSAFASMI